MPSRTMSLFDATVPQLNKMLGNLEAWIAEARTFAKAKDFPVDNLLTARLAPDQYPLVQQIQNACDGAKLCVARLAGQQAPVHEDNETSFDALETRLRSVREYISGFTAEDINPGADREIALPILPENQRVGGLDFANEIALPNFYFHIVTAYAILRHNGVDLGKRAFIGSVNLKTIET